MGRQCKPALSTILAVQNQPLNGVFNLSACLQESLKRGISPPWDRSFAYVALAKPGAGMAALCTQIRASHTPKPAAEAVALLLPCTRPWHGPAGLWAFPKCVLLPPAGQTSHRLPTQ